MPQPSTNPLDPDWAKLREDLVKVQRRRRARPGMVRLLEEWAEDVDKQIRKLASYSAEEQLRLVPAISAHFLRIRALVDALSRGLIIANRVIHEMLEESIKEISGAALTRDIAVVDSPLETRYLESKFKVSSDEVSFVLFVKPGVGYDTLPLLPRVVHEAARCDFEIRTLVAARSTRVRWLGEVCCDLVALCLAGRCLL